MARIRGKDTGPEVRLRLLLFRMGFRYRLHGRGLPGHPDLAFAKYHAVVFVHGCFWHRHAGCRFAAVPKHNHVFWMNKFRINTLRDARQTKRLRADGWRVAVVWECAVRKDAGAAAHAVGEWLTGEEPFLEVGEPVK